MKNIMNCVNNWDVARAIIDHYWPKKTKFAMADKICEELGRPYYKNGKYRIKLPYVNCFEIEIVDNKIRSVGYVAGQDYKAELARFKRRLSR